jgi:hypothetical protein
MIHALTLGRAARYYRARLKPSSTSIRRFANRQSLESLTHGGANSWLLVSCGSRERL